MPHLGELISLVVAVFWTVTALFADKASHRLGSMSANVLRLSLAVVFLGVLLWVSVGRPYPVYASGEAWVWLGLSALVGYVFGDWCLFNCYLSIGARFGQLFMTLAPPMAAIAGWAILGETLTWKAAVAMAVTLSGIAISILSREGGEKMHLTLPLKGVLLGLGAGAEQGGHAALRRSRSCRCARLHGFHAALCVHHDPGARRGCWVFGAHGSSAGSGGFAAGCA